MSEPKTICTTHHWPPEKGCPRCQARIEASREKGAFGFGRGELREQIVKLRAAKGR